MSGTYDEDLARLAEGLTLGNLTSFLDDLLKIAKISPVFKIYSATEVLFEVALQIEKKENGENSYEVFVDGFSEVISSSILSSVIGGALVLAAGGATVASAPFIITAGLVGTTFVAVESYVNPGGVSDSIKDIYASLITSLVPDWTAGDKVEIAEIGSGAIIKLDNKDQLTEGGATIEHDGNKYKVANAANVESLASYFSLTVDQFLALTGNEYVADRIVEGASGDLYIWKEGDALQIPDDALSMFDYQLEYTGFDPYKYDGDFEKININQTQSGVGTIEDSLAGVPIPILKPKYMSYTEAGGTNTNYKIYDVDAKAAIEGKYGDDALFNNDDIIVIENADGTKFSAVDENANVTFFANTFDEIQHSLDSVVDMIEERASKYQEFINHSINEKLLSSFGHDGAKLAALTQGAIGNIISDVINGKNIADLGESLYEYISGTIGGRILIGQVNAFYKEITDSFADMDAFLNNTLGGIVGDNDLFSGATAEFADIVVARMLSGDDFVDIAQEYAIEYAKHINLDEAYEPQITSAIVAATSATIAIDDLIDSTFGAVVEPVLGVGAFNDLTTGLLQDVVGALKNGDDIEAVSTKYGKRILENFEDDLIDNFAENIQQVQNGLSSYATTLDTYLNEVLGGVVGDAAFFSGATEEFIERIAAGLLDGESFEVVARDLAERYAKSHGLESLTQISVQKAINLSQSAILTNTLEDIDVILQGILGAVVEPVFGENAFKGLSVGLLEEVGKTIKADGNFDGVGGAINDFAENYAFEKITPEFLENIGSAYDYIQSNLSAVDGILNNTLGSLIGNETFFNGTTQDILGQVISGVISGDDLEDVVVDAAVGYAFDIGQEILLDQVAQLKQGGAFAGVSEAFAEVFDPILEPVFGKEGLSEVGALASAVAIELIEGALSGDEIEDIILEIASDFVANQGLGLALGQLTDVTGIDFVSEGAVNTVASVLIEMAAQAIISGEFGEVDEVLKTEVINLAINQGVTQLLGDNAKGVFDASGKLIGTFNVSDVPLPVPIGGSISLIKVPSPVSAAAAAAVVSLTMSAFNGGIDGKAVGDAALASAKVAAVDMLTTALINAAGWGSAGGAVGIAVSTAITLVMTGIEIAVFGNFEGERIYHNETISHVVQETPEGDKVILGLRDAGALLIAANGSDDIIGTVGHDVIVGNDNVNLLIGNEGDDMIEGRAHDDAIMGGDGHDHIEAGEGDDYIEGGNGDDKIYGDAGDDSILGGNGDDIISGGAGNDNIEGEGGNDIISGDSGNDIIIGSYGNAVLSGGTGDDIIQGRGGNDNIDGGQGNDELNGGEGKDTITGGTGDDIMDGGEGDDLLHGQEGTDVLYGSLGNDVLDGGDDSDLLYGGIGNDLVIGGEGSDHLYGELGNDVIDGGTGDDLTSGGEGDDVYIFRAGDGKDVIQEEGGSDAIKLVGYYEDDISFKLKGDGLEIIMGDGSDKITISGNGASSSIEYLILADDKVIDMSSLSFDVEGNGGGYNLVSTYDTTEIAAPTEVVSYSSEHQSSSWYDNNFEINTIDSSVVLEQYNDVQVRSLVVKNKTWYGRTGHVHHYYDYHEKNMVGTGANDRIVGMFWDENIDGEGGYDQLYGNGGSDNLTGGADHDLIFGGTETDIIHGNDGTDKIYGGQGDDEIYGDGDNDTLYGEWGDDTIYGGAGDDFIDGGIGNDILHGDAGNDILFSSGAGSYAYGGAGEDYLVGQGVLDGGDDNDVIISVEGTTYIYGGAGDDVIDGSYATVDAGDGDDLIIVDHGGSSIDGGAGYDIVSFESAGKGISVSLVWSNIERVIGSNHNDTIYGSYENDNIAGGHGNDKLEGLEGDDTLEGGAGSDVLVGGIGADYLDGGDGFDTVSYHVTSSGINVNLQTNVATGGEAEGDTFNSIEKIIGSQSYDTLTAHSSGSVLYGMESADNLIGAEGNDELDGGNGQDVINGNDGDDIIRGGADMDVLDGGNDDDIVDGGADNDIIDGGAGNDTLIGGDGKDIFIIRKDAGSSDVIMDFDVLYSNAILSENELIDLSDFDDVFSDYGDIEPSIIQDGNDVVIDLGDDQSLRIKNIQKADIRFELFKGNVGISPRPENTSPYVNIALADQGAAFGELFTYNFATDIFADTENDNLEYSSTLVDGSALPSWLSFDAVTRTFSGTPQIADKGIINVKVIASDGQLTSYDEFAISINDDGEIQTSFLHDVNLVHGNEFQVNSYTANNQTEPDITALQNGNFVVVWESSTTPNQGVYAQLYDSSGNSIGSEFSMSELHYGHQSPSVIALSDGGFVIIARVAGVDGNLDAVTAQIFEADGSRRGSEFQVNSYTALEQGYAKAAALDSGNFVVTWQSDGQDGDDFGVYAQLFDSNGIKIGPEINVNSFNNGFQAKPSIEALQDGKFVVAWHSLGQDGDDIGVYGKVFDESGYALGGEFLINTTTYEAQGNAKISSLDDGGFVVIWQSNKQDIPGESGWGVFGQIYNIDGTARGGEFQVNTSTQHDQYEASVTAIEGGFMVSFADQDSSYGVGNEVLAQIFDNKGNKIGGEVHVNTYTSEQQRSPVLTTLANGSVAITWISESVSGAQYGQDGDGSGVFAKIIEVNEVRKTLFASDDSVIIAQNEVVDIDVIANDIDSDDDVLSIVSIDNTGTEGQVSINTDGTINYDSNGAFDYLAEGESVADTITYTVTDGNGESETRNVTITIEGANDAPESVSLDNYDVDENADGAVIGNLAVVDVDNGDSHIFTVDDTRFEVVAGQLKLKSGMTIDYESETQITVNVTATDVSGAYISQSFVINVADISEVILGTNGADVINGDIGQDVIYAGYGNDVIDAKQGNDAIYAGAGNDQIKGSEGADLIDGGAGLYDTLSYEDSTSAVSVNLSTGAGTGGYAEGDTITGVEIVHGSDYGDFVVGSDNSDGLYGGAGNDTLFGGLGDDIIEGETGSDAIYGSAGNDILRGGGGNDSIYGGSEDDVIIGGLGADILTGGAGSDSFDFTNVLDSISAYRDTIKDFTQGSDIINLESLVNSGVISGFSDLDISNDGTNTIISTNNGTAFELEVEGVINLIESDFAL